MNPFLANFPAFIGGAGPGPFELLIFFAAILMLFGAKRVPEFARSMGRIMEELRRASQDFRSQLMDAGEEFKHDVQDLTVDPDHDAHARGSFDEDIDYDDYHADIAHDPYYEEGQEAGYDPYQEVDEPDPEDAADRDADALPREPEPSTTNEDSTPASGDTPPADDAAKPAEPPETKPPTPSS